MPSFFHDAPPAEVPQDAQPAKPPASWRWFWGGLLVVFVVLSFAGTHYSPHPSGEYVVQCPLWQFYVLEYRHGGFGAATLGPRSSGPSAPLVAAKHLAASLAGGLAGLGVGRFVRSRSSSRALNP